MIKYIKMTASSNFGNICSVAASSIFLPFVPATATQLLLLNLCYDATCLALSWDNVDDMEIARPRAWSGKGLGSFMLHFGFASSAFDIITFAILFLGVCPAVCGAPFAALDAAGRAAFIRPSRPVGCWNAHGPNRSCSWFCEHAASATGTALAAHS